MVYKLYIQDGDYVDNTTQERRNMLIANQAHTPAGLNVGWDTFTSDEEAMLAYDITYDPIIVDASIAEPEPEPELTIEEQLAASQAEAAAIQAELDAANVDKEELTNHINILISENSNQVI